ncbi:MAG: DUF5343 domain-containing protein [Candidatus Paceibacterota bacterium]
MNKEKTTREAKPVYLSVPKLEELIRIVSEHATKNALDASYFEAYGFGNSDATLAISSLRFLGLLNNEGKETELMSKIQLKSEDKRREGFAEVIRKAYKKLFEIEKPYELPTDRIYDEIRGQYQVSPRVARGAVPAFLRLCQFSGFIEGAPKRNTNGNKTKRIKPKSRIKNDSSLDKSGQKYKIIEIVSGKSAIGIPLGSEEKILLDKDARKHLDAFIEAARLYAESIKNEETSDSESEVS